MEIEIIRIATATCAGVAEKSKSEKFKTLEAANMLFYQGYWRINVKPTARVRAPWRATCMYEVDLIGSSRKKIKRRSL